MKFKPYWQSLSEPMREQLAAAVAVNKGHLSNIAYGTRTCGEGLAISIEKATNRAVKCEELRPDVDWEFLRNTA